MINLHGTSHVWGGVSERWTPHRVWVRETKAPFRIGRGVSVLRLAVGVSRPDPDGVEDYSALQARDEPGGHPSGLGLIPIESDEFDLLPKELQDQLKGMAE